MKVARDRIYQRIRERILRGEYEAGERLIETEVASDLDVSRTPVREALQRLASEGLVDFAPNRGARVVGWSDQEVGEIFEVRAVLEGYGARLAAERAGPEDIAKLVALADQMEALVADRSGTTDFEALTRLNNDFHMTILGSAGNEQLVGLLGSLIQVLQVHRTFQRYSPVHLTRSMTHHRELIDAIDYGDSDWAQSLMRAHILAARVVLDEYAARE